MVSIDSYSLLIGMDFSICCRSDSEVCLKQESTHFSSRLMQEIVILFRVLYSKIFSSVIVKIPIILSLSKYILSELAHLKFVS